MARKKAERSTVVSLDDFEAARARARQEKQESSDVEATKARARFVEALYRDHWRTLCRRLRRIYGDGPPEPEDLVQIAFTKVTELEDHTRLNNPEGFLFRIAVNAGLDSVRRIRRTKQLIQGELAALEKGRVEEITPSNVYESREHLAAARHAIDALPPKQREILVRSRIKGETYAQIAKATGWSQSDISRQLTAALGRLQDALRDYSDDEDR